MKKKAKIMRMAMKRLMHEAVWLGMYGVASHVQPCDTAAVKLQLTAHAVRYARRQGLVNCVCVVS